MIAMVSQLSAFKLCIHTRIKMLQQLIINLFRNVALFDITVDGKSKDVYLASPTWFKGNNPSDDSAMDIPWGGRVYLAEAPNVDPEAIFKPNLLGGYIEYDVDLS